MLFLHEVRDSLLHLFFPHSCDGCGNDILDKESRLCIRCTHAMPGTSFEKYPGNPVEKKFWGRLQLEAATAQYYFTRESLMQHLIHHFKYKSNKEIGLQLGRMMGLSLQKSGRFIADALVPLPLFVQKQRKRGYNQAAILCSGIAEYLHVPVMENIVTRPEHTETQTKKGRIERWKNIEGKFVLADPSAIAGKRILLVDDVITTGATLESCGGEILKAENVRLSIACLCDASR